ncbi:MAG: hypothetical protein Q9182_002089 [Xanthomendoza sp. 2 TL-2023]
MRLLSFTALLLPAVLASELASSSTSDSPPHPAVLIHQTPQPQPQRPYLELRHLDLDPRQIQPAAAGAPAQVAAGAAQQPAGGAAAPAVAPVVQAPANPAVPATTAAPATTQVAATAQAPATAPTTAPATANPAAPAVAAPAAPVAPAAGVVPINSGPATAVMQAPAVKSGSIGLGTLTGKVGVVKTEEAKSEARLAADNRLGIVASWPAAFKIGMSVLLGMAVGVQEKLKILPSDLKHRFKASKQAWTDPRSRHGEPGQALT